MIKEKIDMVYLWCDGNEEGFKKRKNRYLQGFEVTNVTQAGDSRFYDNDEIKYSLRSLEKFAPWINHVYIVTDRQIPKWLNTDYEKVTVVDHSEILPSEIIPCFNSAVIEYFITRIKGLNDYFLYSNDDMFFGVPVTPDFFYENGKSIVRVRNRKCKRVENRYDFVNLVLNARELIEKEYGCCKEYGLHHNIDAYRKTDFDAALNRYKKALDLTLANRFRSNNDVSRLLFGLDSWYAGNAVLKIVDNPKPWRKALRHILPFKWESYLGYENDPKMVDDILKYKPSLFCINSPKNCDENLKKRSRDLLEKLFPDKSKFEK